MHKSPMDVIVPIGFALGASIIVVIAVSAIAI